MSKAARVSLSYAPFDFLDGKLLLLSICFCETHSTRPGGLIQPGQRVLMAVSCLCPFEREDIYDIACEFLIRIVYRYAWSKFPLSSDGISLESPRISRDLAMLLTYSNCAERYTTWCSVLPARWQWRGKSVNKGT